ncbi:uncharacterized protein KY384_004188 [Bacidia gigantensis]|uniref:uncharacterized protein n=1 Tax=Bacidia gigantensis TaxID=2732470 RepID=UPI001D046DF2|nr:uncharacterized protein KY384_004188 [Bacidia gigantensis]KAG8530831.1 hypothetical protein KY384_004188 [Bacidia gigantensis]
MDNANMSGKLHLILSFSSAVGFELRVSDRDDLENRLIEANKDDSIDGVIVYYPIFDNRQDQYLQQLPDITKDVEGLSHRYIFKLYHNERYLDQARIQKSILPCTPLAIVKILDYLSVYNNILAFGNRLFGRTITVVNRSETVGRPLAAMLANDGASVYSVDVTCVQQFTRGHGIKQRMHEVVDKQGWTLQECLRTSDVVIGGVPGKSFKIPTDQLKDGVVCINFSTEKNFDCDVKSKASIFVPSIGKVTIAILIRNLVLKTGKNHQKPKTARSKREFEKREPQQVENSKTALFLRYTKSSDLLNSLAKDLHTLKIPDAIQFKKGNAIHPFEDPSSLEFFSQKNDAAFLVLASSSKKRPHTLTWIRCFSGKILDMLELSVVQETARCMAQFKGPKCGYNVKPMLAFSGTAWDDSSRTEYVLAKSLFTDFFRGSEVGEIDVEGLQLLIHFSVGEEGQEGLKPQIQMRCWRIITKKSASKVPKVEVEEIGPRMDFRVGRSKEAEGSMMKEALKRAKGTEAKAKKNIETDFVGDKMGRIHLGRQDLSELQTRKMKGLKRARDQDVRADGIDNEDIISQDDDDEEMGGVEIKRPKTS